MQQQGTAGQRQQSTPPPANPLPPYLLQYYNIMGKIGEGTYGVVYLAKSKEDPIQTLAVKAFKPGKEADGVSPTAVREIMLLKELSHENIVRLDSVHLNREDPCLALAFVYAEHDLYEMIRFHRDHLHSALLDHYVIKSLMWQLLQGLTYLHQNWVLHRDLKPSNILVMGDGEEQGRVKIADFGLARIFRAPLRPLSDNGVVVTIWYRAPELLLGTRHYTPAVDVWAAGCIFAELLTLRPLFQGEEKKHPGAAFQSDQVDKIFRLLGHPSPKQWPDLERLHHWRDNTANVRVRRPEHPPASAPRLEEHLQDCCGPHYLPRGSSAVQLLTRMLEYDPLKRITAYEALHHEYFQQEPLPGLNAFVYQGRPVVQYPRRTKVPPGPPAPPPPTQQPELPPSMRMGLDGEQQRGQGPPPRTAFPYSAMPPQHSQQQGPGQGHMQARRPPVPQNRNRK